MHFCSIKMFLMSGIIYNFKVSTGSEDDRSSDMEEKNG